MKIAANVGYACDVAESLKYEYNRKLIREQTVEELAEYLKSNDFPHFAPNKSWIGSTRENMSSFEEMKNLLVKTCKNF